MSTCISKKTNVQIIRSRTACNSKIQTTALWQRPVGKPVAPSITSVAMELLGIATLNIAPPKTDGGARITSYIVTSSPGQVRATFKPGQIKAAKISGLIPGNTYSFSVVAVNSKGPSPASLATSPARAPIPVPVPTPQPVQQPVPLPIQVSEPLPTPTPTPTPTVSSISVAAIDGVTVPVTGANPVTTTTAGAGYTGTVTWSGSPTTFASATSYTATITLTATTGFTLTGVRANFFTVVGASTVSHSANSGVITAVFPATSLSLPAFTLSSSSETRTVNTAATGFSINSTGGAIESFAISATPPGMSFDTSTGALTGTPTTVASATAYTVTATNATGSTTQTFTLTVSRAAQATLSITTLTTSTKAYPYEQALSITTSGGSGFGATTFAIASGGSASGCALSNSTATATITATTVGTCLIQATKAADSTYDEITSAAATFTFTKATQSISLLTVVEDATYGASPGSALATSNSGLTVAVTSATSAICSLTGTTLTLLAAGTCIINANQAGDANYEAAMQVVIDFPIAKATQSISFTTPSAMTVGGSTQTVAPTASSSLTVTLTSTTTGICTVAGFVITAVGSGTCSITASQTGNTNYEAAADVITTFSITAVINIAAIAGVAAPVAGATPVSTTTAGTGYTGTVSWSGSPSTFASGTIYTATITLTATSGYTLTGVSANFFTVAGATSVTHSANSGVITAVFPAAPRTISDQNIGMTRPITGRTPATTITGEIGYTGTISWAGSPTTFASATSYTATITLTPRSGYTLTGISANFFRVGVATVTHSANSGVITAVFPATDTTISVAAVAGVTAPVTGATPVSTTTAGTGYTGTVTWSGSPSTFSGDTIYTATIRLDATFGYTLTGVSANFFTVQGATSVTHSADSGVITAVFPATAKLSQSITFTDPADISYGISPSSLSATSNSGLTVAFTTATSGVCTVSGTTVTILSAGTCTLNANQAGNANYETASQVSQSFTIAKASQSITFTDPEDITYGQSPSSLSATSTSTLTVAFTSATSGVCTVIGTTLTLLTAGTCTINANQAGDTNYEAASQVAQSFTIAKATPSLSSFNNTFRTKDVPTFTLIAPTVANSLPGSFSYTSATTATATISGDTVTLGNVGTTVITATFTPTDTTNYNNASIQMTLTVSRATQATLSITSLTTNSKTYSQLSNSQALSITTSGGSGTGAITFAIALGGSATGCALSNSTATATVSANSAGTCWIRATKAADSTYDARSSETVTFTFTKATPTLSEFPNLSKTIGDAAFDLTLPTAAPPIEGSFSFSSATTATATISSQRRVTLGSAGTTVITATFTPTDTTNYNNATIQMTLTVSRITQATLSITTLTTSTKAYPYEQALSITTSGGSGFGATTFAIASGGSASGCALSNSTATATITATTVGTCLIQATKAADSTYDEITSAAATFTFTKATQSITFTDPADITYGTSPSTLTATSTSTLTVAFTAATSGVCSVSGTAVTVVSVGTCTINANQAGNADYEAASQVVQSFAISKASQTVTFTAPSDMTVGDTPASLLAISTSGLTVAFTTATSGVCTVSGTTVTVVSVGTCTINANQAGNTNFEPASQVAQSFTIAKATPNLSNFANLSKTTANAPFTLSPPTVANSLPGSFTYTSATTATATISGTTVTLGSAGTTVITATFTPTDTANYNSATIALTLTVRTATCAEGGVCAVGDRGPGGGYVFYVSAANFTSTGSTCNTTCKYLEVAPSDWQNNYPQNDPARVLQYQDGGGMNQVDQNFGDSTEGFNTDEKVNWRIGQGFYNTSLFTGPAAATVLAYAGNSSAGQWFIPSMNELNELCKYVYGQATGNPKDACTYTRAADFKSTANVGGTDRGGFVQDFYWSSSQHYQTTTWVWFQSFGFNTQQVANYKWLDLRIRPIRAFGP